MIFDIHDKLTQAPGTHKLRQKLLEDAARDLIQLSEQIQSADQRGDRSLGAAYLKIGDTLLLLGQTVPAQEMYRKCLEIMQAIHQAKPDNAQARRDLSISHDKLGNVSMQLGFLKAAKEYFEKSLKLREQLAQQDPDNAQARGDLSVSYNKLGNVSMRVGRPDRPPRNTLKRRCNWQTNWPVKTRTTPRSGVTSRSLMTGWAT